MEIRFITPDDSPEEISNIYEQSWKYAYKGIIPQDYLDSIPKGKWAANIRSGRMQNLVIEKEGRLIGTSGFCPSRWEKFGGYGEIVSIYMLPEYIGSGYGKQLISRCISELAKLGFSDILLWVLEDNERARRFYERNGFTYSGAYLEDEIGGKKLREVMYTIQTNINGE